MSSFNAGTDEGIRGIFDSDYDLGGHNIDSLIFHHLSITIRITNKMGRMQFEWDEDKNQRNINKHGVRFEDACLIFEGFTLDLVGERFDYGEIREISIGQIKGVAIVVVVHTDRNGSIRLISARPAVKSERRMYEQAIREVFEH